jgi:hypothetical protein
LGIAGFLVAAIPIYYGKLRRRGPVTGGIYKLVRHPQYASLILCSFGLLLVWPRNIVVITFVAVVFAYYFLARAEEQECSAKFGQPFDDYVQRTGMFLPFDSWLLRRLPSLHRKSVRRNGAVLGCFVAALIIGLAPAHALRVYSVRSLYAAYTGDSAIVSVVPLDDLTMQRATGIARSHPEVMARVQVATTVTSRLLVYVLPAQWFESDIPMNMAGHRGHYEPRDWDRNRLKVLVMQAVVDEEKAPVGEKLLLSVCDRRPIVEATVRWGGIPTPID